MMKNLSEILILKKQQFLSLFEEKKRTDIENDAMLA